MVNKAKLVRSGFLRLGFNLNIRTDSARVLQFIKKLQPQDCGIELTRIGGPGDGGYLIPRDLEGIEYCFSPGVNTISNFENELADLHIKSFMADYSVDGPPVARPEFTFDKKFLGSTDGGHFMTLSSWKDKYLGKYAGDLLLQMDIEGCEYEAILSTPDSLLNQFRIMAIEFHFLDRLFDPFVFSLISSCFDKILQFFYVVHAHPNNCGNSVAVDGIEVPEVIEFTFINKRRARPVGPQLSIPHKLDADNKPTAPSLHLPKHWYASQ
ncbi:MAG: hypothetical protein ACLGSD_10180 [Acidobacteriota bacterium]